eukprot:GHVT01022186.1.p1 GENE.GHVT01022186.1~~GHVT01022186.1.p1  ORF type:complete len:104 (+),score=14.10 GHVT01022186.1:631-942(+)
MAVAGVCFIGKQNEPLALRLYDTSEDELAFQFASFASLDVIEERFASAAGADLDAISAGFFRMLHRLYADAVCNPFLLDTIQTPMFIKRLDQLVGRFVRSWTG